MTSNVIGPSREIVTNSAPSSEPVRFCKDCKWCEPFPLLMKLSGCRHSLVVAEWDALLGGVDPVSGERPTDGTAPAKHTRQWEHGACGPAAKLFEPITNSPTLPAKSRRYAWAALTLVALSLVVLAYFVLRAFAGGAS